MGSSEKGGIDFGEEIKRMALRIERSNPDIPIFARVQKAWRSIASSQVLEHTDAVFVVPNTYGEEVVVYVDSQIWAADLNLQAELLRLRLNLAIHELLVREGRAGTVSEDDALFGYEDIEHVKKLKFSPSKEKYRRTGKTGRMNRVRQDEDLEIIEPVPLDEQELSRLCTDVMDISDDELREKAFEAARKHLELLKGRNEQADSPEAGN